MTVPYGTDYTCDHGEPPDGCNREGCPHNPDTAYLAELDEAEQERAAQEQRQAAHERAVSELVDRMQARREAEERLRATHRPAVPAAYTLDRFLELGIPPVRYRIDELWPVGSRVMLAAQAKAGKTTMRDNLARALVDGDPFLDKYDVTRTAGRVGIIDTELDQGMLQRWLADQHIREENRLWIQPLRGYVSTLDLLDEQCRRSWARRLQAAEVDTLVLDCLGPVLSAFGLDESSNVDAGRWLLAFEALLNEAGIVDAVLVHHFGHNAERSRGASRLQDWPDVLWRLMKAEPQAGQPADPRRYFAADGRDVHIPEGHLDYEPMERHLRFRTGSRQTAQRESDIETLIAWLRDNPEPPAGQTDWGITEIKNAKPGDIAEKRCAAAIQEAVRQGRLCQHAGPKRRQNIRIKTECGQCGSVRQADLPHTPDGLFE